MKYLYKILRLFFCPHKFDRLLAKGPIVEFSNGPVVGNYYNKECVYCGKVRGFNIK